MKKDPLPTPAAAGKKSELLPRPNGRADAISKAASATPEGKGTALGARDAAVEANIPDPTAPLRDLSATLQRLVWLLAGLLIVGGVIALGVLCATMYLAYVVLKGRTPSLPPERGAPSG